jgi:hypothetical protein
MESNRGCGRRQMTLVLRYYPGTPLERLRINVKVVFPVLS